ncbi:MAG: Fimbrial assembly protein (PilN) [Alphaproteobacteria bacterium ADurb.BinA280]|jgi:general secretion pathway protein L|nr:MAG: Fimbrial assembly protein (PilN) [Alphaproteobacteria bacterium ADurb.BinA280]
MSVADVIQPMLLQLRARYAQTALPAFFAWWWGELRSLLPAGWRQALAAESASLAFTVVDRDVRVEEIRSGQRREVMLLIGDQSTAWQEQLQRGLTDALRELPKILLLPSAVVLRRALPLPLAALENLRQVCAFELDRQTPFKLDQVYFDSLVLRRDLVAKQAHVELVVLPRAVLDSAVVSLGSLATQLNGVDVMADHGALLGVNILPSERRAARGHSQLYLNLGLAMVSLLLVLIGMSAVLENRLQAVAAMEADVDEQRTAARLTAGKREQLGQAAEAANFLAEQKRLQPSMVLMLQELTHNLPDDTFLERLNVSKAELSITGQSAKAAQLVKRMQDSSMLESPALNGPIQPDGRTGLDRFTLTMHFIQAIGDSTNQGAKP